MSLAGLQRYQIMESLGAGGQGTTFRGIDRTTGDAVAIKVLRLGSLDDWKGFDLFERECDVLATLDHPQIPRFIDRFASESTGDYFLVMDLVDGRSLRRRAEDGERFDQARLRRWFEQTLDVLEYLHGRRPPVIHRDIKPGNLVCDGDDRVHLVDFGGVRVAAHGADGTTVVGTFGFMAPEQLHGEASPATDLYALAATFAALAGGLDAESLPRRGLKIDVNALPLGDLAPALDAMLEPDPGRRVRSAAEARALLRRPASRRRAPPPSSSAPQLRRPSDSTRALVPISDGVRELAEVEHPLFRFVIWAFASIVTGTLVLLEAVLIPIVFALFGGMARRSGRDDEHTRQREETLGSVAQGRANMAYLARKTQPFGDD